MLAKLPSRYETSWESVTFKTPLGDVTGQYYPVVDAGDYIVLGLSPQSFIPKPYKEAPDLRFNFIYKQLNVSVLYSGCKFKDPDTDREYIILMKVGK